MNFSVESYVTNGSEIAITGLSGRFPGAKTVNDFWHNLKTGVESISFFTDEELLALGIESDVLKEPKYIKAAGVLEDVEQFDAEFFNFSPKEAEITDPQHRLFLECAWDALENAGYDAKNYNGSIGVYGGSGLSSYLLNIYLNPELKNSIDLNQMAISGDKDFLTTRVSYKLDLEGPSYTVQTACSTSLVAVHLASQGLLNGECDMALAGGVFINSSRKHGYFYKEGGINSPDGHCRAFDAKARGTVGGEGAGIVVLKRLEDALADGDYIHAVLKGSALNNDGSFKVSYTAPRIDTQAKVIKTAQAIAEVEPETITYIEAHGTGTSLGDPIEIAALTQAFGSETPQKDSQKGFCAIGSVKTNIGHLNTAAGVTGLIKTVLALKHKQIPPSLHFEEPNPQIDFANSPFYVNTALSDWQANGTPRRAGVSSFGIGGTNAHVILEEAPVVEPSGKSRPWQLLLLSAKTSSALETATANLTQHLHGELNLADVAYTLSLGRRAFNHRRMLVCQDIEDAKNAMGILEPKRVLTQFQEPGERSVVFMFSGQGAQYVNMARELYQSEPTFAEHIDSCCELFIPHLGLDLRQVLYPNPEQLAQASEKLLQTAITQPALFVIEYALAQLWKEWGVHPAAAIGHSIGEYVAATIAGVFSLEDALALVAARGKLMQQLPPGSMLAVPLPETQVQPLLGKELSLAAVNGTSSCVVSGEKEAVEALEKQLAARGVECRRLHTSHAFHSPMMEPILESFRQEVEQVSLKAPQTPYISNVTGTWITPQEATSPGYWTQHIRQTVRFEEGLQELLKEPTQILLEIGPGRTLTTLAKRHPDKKPEHVAISSVRHPKEAGSDVEFLLKALGQLWLAGVEVNWSEFYAREKRHRLPLPTYPFERQRYWIEPAQLKDAAKPKNQEVSKRSDISEWFYVPSWKRLPLPARQLEAPLGNLLLFVDEWGLGTQLLEGLQKDRQNVIVVRVGTEFTQVSEGSYTLNPGHNNDYDRLLTELQQQQKLPEQIVHLWSVTPVTQAESELAGVENAQETGFYSLLFLAQALGKLNLTQELPITVVSNNMQSVTGEESLSPEKATLLGPVKVISQEYANISCRSIDVVLPPAESWQREKLTQQLLTELKLPMGDRLIAYRGNNRWLQAFEPLRLDESLEQTPRLREGGVYLITGGLGGIGLVLAKHLARTVRAKLILTGRSAFPAREEWDSWLATHDRTDSISRKIGKVRELEALGAQVLVVRADVANLEQMTDAIAQIQKHFGQLNGVIHAAGILGEESFAAIAQITKTNCERQFQPKVYGLLVLEKVLQDRDLDFCFLLSSLSSVLGGLGYAAYAAANLFMDAFVDRYRQTSNLPWFSVNWDGWKLDSDNPKSTLTKSNLAELSLIPEEGIKAFKRILSSEQFSHQIVVSTGDLKLRLKQWIDSKSLGKRVAEQKVSLHPRPDLHNSFVAPSNEIEQKLADIWQTLLGIEQVGMHDNFFELGGDSLVAIQVISRVQKTLHTELPVNSIFKNPTVAELAEYIDKTRYTIQQLQTPISTEMGEMTEIEL